MWIAPAGAPDNRPDLPARADGAKAAASRTGGGGPVRGIVDFELQTPKAVAHSNPASEDVGDPIVRGELWWVRSNGRRLLSP